jgi:thiamine biosynthesis lipoprotein ApbE
MSAAAHRGAVLVARRAMATRFEIVLHGDNPTALRAAGEEALDEVQRLEDRLSLYRPASEIARVNALAHREPVRVSPPVFRLLEQARRLHQETGGAFDITMGPLLRCWGLMGGVGRVPSPDELAAARACAGMDKVHLDPENYTVRFERPGLTLDLGAIGKGHAVESAANLLLQAGLTSAFIHGGTSSSYAIGRPPDQPTWKVALELPLPLATAGPGLGPGPVGPHQDHPDTPLVVPALAGSLVVPALAGPLHRDDQGGESEGHPNASLVVPALAGPLHPDDHRGEPGTTAHPSAPSDGSRTPFAVVPLTDESLSVSAVWGKSFQVGDKTYGHVIDPRTGAPAEAALLAAVVLPSATEADALSTALLVLGPAGQAQLNSLQPGMRSVVVHRQGERVRIEAAGLALLP